MLHPKLLFITLLASLLSCAGQTENKDRQKYLKPSYKEIITASPDSTKFIEFFDSTANIYSNFKYGFSIKFPQDWQIDKGFSEHTVVRGYQEDNAATFSVNVIEVDVNRNSSFSLWSYFDENRSNVEAQYKTQIEKLLNSQISEYSAQKVYLDNHEAIQREFMYSVKNFDTEINMKGLMYQVTNVPFVYTIGLHVPLLFFNADSEGYRSLINGFYFTYPKSK